MDWLHKIGTLLPVTVVVAISLFILRECVDLVKKYREKQRKTRAIKLLLAEELERNHWALLTVFNVLKEIKEYTDEQKEVEYSLIIARNGMEHYHAELEDGHSGSGIFRFDFSVYEKLLVSIAELDEELFEAISATYTKTRELNHYRDTLLDYLSGEDLAPTPEMTKGFLCGLSEEEADYYGHLNDSYKLLTGSTLEKRRLW
ncbi:hypothetical protein [Vibrio splendidus]|uniref:hypothetical protein n=1 Tax=Vibrio splendidus TaxID=29497 RepID=UPI0008090EC3|nr:hypothetical protein [Vibrio splendidus]SBS66023.1 hypothetical protein VHE8714_03054 [Vibrio splendidus]